MYDFVISEQMRLSITPNNLSCSATGRLTKGAGLAAKSRALLYMASPLNNPSNSMQNGRQLRMLQKL